MVEFETVYRQRQACILEPRGREFFPLCQKRANKNRHFALIQFLPAVLYVLTMLFAPQNVLTFATPHSCRELSPH